VYELNLKFPKSWAFAEKFHPRVRYEHFLDKTFILIKMQWNSQTLDFWNLPETQTKSHFPQSNTTCIFKFLFHCLELPNFRTVLVSLGCSRNWDVIVHLHDTVPELERSNFD